MSEQMAYVGIYECGCMQSATIDDPEHKAQVRKDVSAFMRQGATIERWSAGKIRVAFCFAKHKPACPHPGACPELTKAAEARHA